MEAGEGVSHVLESVRRKGRQPKRRRWRAEVETGGGGEGLFANDPIDVEVGVACVDDNSGIMDGAKVKMETNIAKDVVRFRDNLVYEVGVLENDGFLVSVGNGKGSLISDGKDVSVEDVKGEGRLEVRNFHRGSINLNITAEEEDMEVKRSVTCDGNLEVISKGLGEGRFDLNCSIDLNVGLDMENGYGERFDFQGLSAKGRRIDLNLEATIDLDENTGLYGKRGVIDLNLGPDCEVVDGDDRSKVQESTLTSIVVSDEGEGKVSWEEEKFVEVDVKYGKLEKVHSDGEELSRVRISVCCQDKDVDSVDPLGCERIDYCPPRAIEVVGDFSSSVQQEYKGDEPGNARNNDIPGDSESPYTIGSGCRRKRKSHDRVKTSETVLRRSTRRGFFHKRHVRKSAEGIAADCKYTCHKCQAGRSGKILESAGGGIKPKKSIKKKSTKATSEKVKSSVKTGISSGKSKKVVGKLRIIRLKRGGRLTCKRKTARKLIVKAATNGRSVPAVFLLRRSARQAMKNPSLRGKIQAKKNMSLKEKVHTESTVQKRIRSERRISSRSRSGLSWKKKRAEAHYSYWVNGLRFSGRLSDERVKQFKEKNVISSGDAKVELKCHLCREGTYPSMTNFLACETCREWYHGDAFGLNDEKLRQLIRFRCNKCCGKMPPLCAWLIALTSDHPPDC